MRPAPGILIAVFFLGLGCVIWEFVSANSPAHRFEGKCQMCHATVPEPGTPFEDIVFSDSADRLCANCHSIDPKTSHPVGVRPSTAIPLQRYLDNEGKMTCLTCHDVHKEEKSSFSKQELKGLLRGHARGRSFCFVCHNEEILGANWRHSMVVTYAHASDRLFQKESGSPLDQFSVECLSCHDGIISKMTPVQVKEGNFQHSIGLSHPVGVVYPFAGRDDEFVARNNLPRDIRLFNGTVGCLSCHNPYAGKKNLLVMDNARSALCLSCHRK